jgi:hypothetical protein
LGYRITLTGIRRIQAIGGFQVAVDGAAGRALTTSTIGEPLDVFNTLDTANEANRLATLLLAGNTSESPVGLLPRPGLTAEQVGPLRVEAVPRTEIELRVVTTAHIPAFWGGVVLLLLGVLIITCVPAYRVRLYRSSDGHGTLNIEAAGLLARPKRLLEPIEKQWTQLDNSETDSVDVDRTPSEGPA